MRRVCKKLRNEVNCKMNKRLNEMISRIKGNENVMLVIHGIVMGIMLICIFLHLINTEMTTAPEFIYNQF